MIKIIFLEGDKLGLIWCDRVKGVVALGFIVVRNERQRGGSEKGCTGSNISASTKGESAWDLIDLF